MGILAYYRRSWSITVYYGRLWDILGSYGIVWNIMTYYKNVKGYCSHLCRANTGLRVGPERRDPFVGVHIERILV